MLPSCRGTDGDSLRMNDEESAQNLIRYLHDSLMKAGDRPISLILGGLVYFPLVVNALLPVWTHVANRVVELDISDCTANLDPPHAIFFYEMISKVFAGQVKSIILGDAGFNELVFAAVLPLLVNSVVTRLTLNKMGLGAQQLWDLANGYKSILFNNEGACRLRHLGLNENVFLDGGEQDANTPNSELGWQAVVQLINMAVDLNSLHLGMSRPGPFGSSKILGNLAEYGHSFRELDFSSFTFAAAADHRNLIALLTNSVTDLRDLKLSELDGEAMMEVFGALSDDLQCLTMDTCSLDDGPDSDQDDDDEEESAESPRPCFHAFLEFLATKAQNLQELSIEGNSLDDESLVVVLHALVANGIPLRKLDVTMNSVGNGFADAIINYQRNRFMRLEELRIGGFHDLNPDRLQALMGLGRFTVLDG